MSISSVNSYTSAPLQWQGQQLKSTGTSSASSSSSNSLSSLFNSGASMTSQLSSMVELTKYAMESMGLSDNSRVTFSQITKYREQLLSSFNDSVKSGLSKVGISNPQDITFALDKDGKLTASSSNAADQKAAQAWLDSNPSLGKDLRASLTTAGIDASTTVSMKVSSTGKLSVVNTAQAAIQDGLDASSDQSAKLRAALSEMGVDLSTTPMNFTLTAEGRLVASDGGDQATAVNKWLEDNTALADTLAAQLKKQNVDSSAVSLRLGATGNVQVTVNNSDLTAAQGVLDKSSLGQTLNSGLNSLGVDANVKFTLQVNTDGSVTVISDGADQAKIQQFFNDNPKLVKQYQQIEALSGLDDARKAMQVSPSEMRKRIQVESMAAWWSGSNNASSYFGSYSEGNMSVLAGLNRSV
ncbi:hypothetical protein [Desulfovibrio sp. 86]|uniref:Uncharacterized protein n=1 Tax=uncultured Desulfovibrio sp. TaxID=167968 RepID=A0A212LAY7_9BACT|nr:hypothetical protein [Desulfovibrio sp. 86]SCM74742.1 conserved hypothetical protein [uncultured Desulfovibrio sp.]VZH35020.1 conserved protein of unknown function [Desulfovibrio sp. 86]